MREALGNERLLGIYTRVAGRYDFQHGLLTARSDHAGRRVLVESIVTAGDRVLDCGSGTGATALLAARKTGPSGSIVLFDLSDAMIAESRDKFDRSGLETPVIFQTGDMLELPFEDDCFDVVLSTYSLCPVYDPAAGARELYRVLKPGGKLGVAHSAEPRSAFVRWIAGGVEALAWRFPQLTMGCRPVEVLSALVGDGAEVLLHRRIGIPLWPFIVFVVRKPDAAYE